MKQLQELHDRLLSDGAWASCTNIIQDVMDEHDDENEAMLAAVASFASLANDAQEICNELTDMIQRGN
jgi:hypothetical protein